MRWEYHPADQYLAANAALWDEFNRASFNHVLLDSRFAVAALRCFGSPETLLGTFKNATSGGAALLSKAGPGVWETFQPAQAPIGFLILSGNPAPQEAMIELLSSLPGPAVQLGIMQQDPDFSLLSGLLNGPQVEHLDYIQIPRLTIAGTFDEYWNNRSKNLKHNLTRQRKRLAEQGRRLELLACRDPQSVAAAVREFGRLESQGWKGQEGTAIAENNSQGRFYKEILESFCSTGEGVIYQLLLDGQVVASDLCVARNGMLVVLKTAYDETVEKLSPALLMREDILQTIFEERSVQVVEFYGKVLDWHLKWTDEVRGMYHVNFFRNRFVAGLRDIVKHLR
jgi:Acetyltransferase (GNAT) domain